MAAAPPMLNASPAPSVYQLDRRHTIEKILQREPAPDEGLPAVRFEIGAPRGRTIRCGGFDNGRSLFLEAL